MISSGVCALRTCAVGAAPRAGSAAALLAAARPSSWRFALAVSSAFFLATRSAAFASSARFAASAASSAFTCVVIASA
eukprot:6223170-Pyramimonas_sp.AAC.1